MTSNPTSPSMSSPTVATQPNPDVSAVPAAKPVYLVSDSDENFSSGGEFGTREDAIAEGRALFGGAPFYTGLQAPPEYPTIDAAGLLERLAEQACDDNEFAEEWLTNVTEEQERELEQALNQVFEAWMDRHGHRPRWFDVHDIERHQGTERDEVPHA